jgi:hypothetical protein
MMVDQDVYNSKDLKIIMAANIGDFVAPMDLAKAGLQGDPIVTLSFADDQSGYEEDHTGETGVFWGGNSKKGSISFNNVLNGSVAHKFLNKFYEAQRVNTNLLATVLFESPVDEETHTFIGKLKKKPDLVKGYKVNNSEWIVEGKVDSATISLDSLAE